MDKNISNLRLYFSDGYQISKLSRTALNLESIQETSSAIHKLRQVSDKYNKSYSQNIKISPGDLLTLTIIIDILRYIFHAYCFDLHPESLIKSNENISNTHGKNLLNDSINNFIDLYPPQLIWNRLKSNEEFLPDKSDNLSNSILTNIELSLLGLNTQNKAFKPFVNLYDDTDLVKRCPYSTYIDLLESEFSKQPAFEPLGDTLFNCLKAPMKASPDSLYGQLEYIKNNWSHFLPHDIILMIHLAVDILKEEDAARTLGKPLGEVMTFAHAGSEYDDSYPEPALYSRDADWMSNVVLMAKSVFVWLDQLSKKYGREIKYLNEIPDEELDRLAHWGFNGLWLIGLWERSSASRTIKKIMGNPEAVSSAYSLYDYTIAEDLGGFLAYQNLKERAWRRGIRLASDMVPNHMGIYSKWIMEHPDWFLQSPYPPFPAYQFTGVNLSEQPHINIQIEDGYWEHRDASVVFKRTDNNTGDTKYIYHGNDGTSTPWNDTAQLNFMKTEVREAVIQTIIHVARMFPIIRFDAAMTLAKKHYQRLWFPKPGEGGAIPSRAEHSMTKKEFDDVFPKEFWREVVDRVAAEVPDTLLLAEAFWLMEGYFVRTLGMHRVYNSAFMNMLKDEDNANYRMTIKNVLEFSPQILKRFVNFMNNPDEKTAVEQFGKEDKYFGIALMMATLPGLPMFGHGQIEGFSEKYGMEYKKAYYNEEIDYNLVRRHEYEIFPLLKRRYQFSGSEYFALFDFVVDGHNVDENVFVYSNLARDDRSLIVYNNAYNTTEGVIHTSTAINLSEGSDKDLIRKTLIDALHLQRDNNSYYSIRNHKTNLRHLIHPKDIIEKGWRLKLFGYQYYSFVDFEHIHDFDGIWGKLYNRLQGEGIMDLNYAYREIKYEPLLNIYGKIINSLFEHNDNIKEDILAFYEVLDRFVKCQPELDIITNKTVSDYEFLCGLHKNKTDNKNSELEKLLLITFAFSISDSLTAIAKNDNLFNDALLCDATINTVVHKYHDKINIDDDLDIISFLSGQEGSIFEKNFKTFVLTLLDEKKVQSYLKVNVHNDRIWFNKEQFERFCVLNAIIFSYKNRDNVFDKTYDEATELIKLAKSSKYQFNQLMKSLEKLTESE